MSTFLAGMDGLGVWHVVGHYKGHFDLLITRVKALIEIDLVQASFDLGFTLLVALDEPLQGQVGSAELTQVFEAGSDARIRFPALLLCTVDNLQDCVVLFSIGSVLHSLVFFSSFVLFSGRINLVNRLKDLAQLVGGDARSASVRIFGLQDAGIVPEVLGVDFLNDVRGSEDTPAIIDASSVILESSELSFVELSVGINGAVFALSDSAVEGQVRRALLSLGEDSVPVCSCYFVRDLSVSKALFRGSNNVNYLARYLSESRGFPRAVILNARLSLIFAE